MTPVRRALVAAALACAAAGCVSAQDCLDSIPADLRADAMRYVLDRKLVEERLMPKPAIALGYTDGAPYERLSEDRRRILAPYAVGYASCIQERVDRE